VIDAILGELLPADDRRRHAMLLFIAFHTASLTDPSLARAEALQVPRALIETLAVQLRKARQAGAVRRDVDPDKEATILVTMVSGLASGVLAGNHTAEQAGAIVDYALDRLWGSG
jgi:TetR/AcrR family transcriptional repressor of bet genes